MNKNKLTLKNVDVEVKLLSGLLRKCSKIHGFYAGVQKKAPWYDQCPFGSDAN